MTALARLLVLYNWAAICALLFFLFMIARFFERRRIEKNAPAIERFRYPYFLVPIVLFALSALLYAVQGRLIVGNVVADLLRIVGAVIFIYSSYSLLSTMMGGRS